MSGPFQIKKFYELRSIEAHIQFAENTILRRHQDLITATYPNNVNFPFFPVL
jgi:hypothetical protein